MAINVSKISPAQLSRNLPKVLCSRPYSQHDKPRKNISLNPSPTTLNKVNILGTFGIASALLASYLIVRRSHQVKEELQLLPVSPPARVPEVSLLAKDDPKEEHLREQYNFIRKVVNDCAGAVFYLELRDPKIRDPETGQALVISNGSGFIISEDGWALTNAHVVLHKPHSTVTAIMRDVGVGRSYNVKVEDADMNIDLALLKLETAEKLPSLQFGESGDTAVGEWVVALGSPLSLSNSVTVGIISSVDRPAEELGLKNYSMTYLQTDASITFGNSGGPLVNLDGHVIGINNLRLTSGISFAIPAEYAKKFLENSKFRLQNQHKTTSKILYGLTMISITPEILTDMRMLEGVTQGLLVWKVIPGTPAHRCGLEVGDIITHVNGIPVEKPAELYNLSGARSTLDLGVINKGRNKIVTLKIT